jgi:hypothetical protein
MSEFNSGISLINEYNSAYQEAYYCWNPYYPLANIDLRAYLGDQWDEKEKQALYDQGRNQRVFNLIYKNINMVDGYQRAHRLSSVILPQESSKQESADEMSDLVQYVFSHGDAYKNESDCFSGAIKTGWNLGTVWMDFRDDLLDGEICFGREPYSGFIAAPYFTQQTLDDCPYIIRRKYMGPEQAASLLPGMEDEVWDLHKTGWSRDDKFTWLPYQRQPNGQELIAYNEYYKQLWKKVPSLVDTQTGELIEWTGGRGAMKYLLEKYPQLKVIQKPKRFIECHIILNNTFFKTEVNQYGLDEYPFTPYFGTFESECELWGLKLQSLIRPMIDPQKETNRRLSQMTDLIESQINSGWIADEDSVVNPRSLFQTSQGKVVWRSKDSRPGAIEKIPPADIPQSFFQLTETFSKGMSEILGVNDAAFGIPESGNESGVMMQLRQGAAINNLQNVFDSLRQSRKLLTRKVIKLIQTWSPKKIERILGRKPTEQFFTKDFIKYDISIQEGMMTDTQRQMHFRQMVDMYQLTGGPQGSPITPMMLTKAAPIQGATEMFKDIEENQKQQAQAAQTQSQVQMQLVEGQMQYEKAAAMEKVAGAKERFTRSVANLGLEDERASRMVDDRATAALSRAKAIKELSTIDDDRLVKYASIIKMFEEISRSSENQVKQDDVQISKAGGAQAEAPLAEGLALQGAGQQQQEVPNG